MPESVLFDDEDESAGDSRKASSVSNKSATLRLARQNAQLARRNVCGMIYGADLLQNLRWGRAHFNHRLCEFCVSFGLPRNPADSRQAKNIVFLLCEAM